MVRPWASPAARTASQPVPASACMPSGSSSAYCSKPAHLVVSPSGPGVSGSAGDEPAAIAAAAATAAADAAADARAWSASLAAADADAAAAAADDDDAEAADRAAAADADAAAAD